MKHTTKKHSNTDLKQKKSMIGLRLDDQEMQLIKELAAKEERSLAQMARVFLRRGIAASNQD